MTVRQALLLVAVVAAIALPVKACQDSRASREEERVALEAARRFEESRPPRDRIRGEAPAPEPAAPTAGGAEPRPEGDAFERPEASRRDEGARELQERIAALEAELAQVRAELVAARAGARAGDLRRRHLDEHFAANELVHEGLWRALWEVVLDGEAVVQDPARVFAPAVALAEAAALRGAPRRDGERRVEPEPAAEESSIVARAEQGGDAEWTTRGGAEAKEEITYERVSLDVRLQLRHAPPRWSGDALSLDVELRVVRRSNGGFELEVKVEGPGGFGGADSQYHLDVRPRESQVLRSPWRGGSEHRELEPGETALPRADFDRLFEQLRSLAL